MGEVGGQDEDDESMVPGLGLASTAGAHSFGSIPGLWWDREEETEMPSLKPGGGQFETANEDFIPGLTSLDTQYGRATYPLSLNYQEPSYEGERDEFGRDRERSAGGEDEWRRGRGGHDGEHNGNSSSGYRGGVGGHNRSARYGPQRRGGRY